MRDYRVYCITSNGYNYIGQTIQDKDGMRIGSFHRCFKIYDKLDKDNWSYKIIQRCKSQKELDEREAYWIENIECVNKHIGNKYKHKSKKEYDRDYNIKNKEKRKEQYRRKATPEYIKATNHRRRVRNQFKCSWGGDARFNNNLLLIELDLFL